VVAVGVRGGAKALHAANGMLVANPDTSYDFVTGFLVWGERMFLGSFLGHHGVDTRDQLLALDVIGLREVAPDGSFGIIHVIRNDGHKPAPLGPDRTMAELDPRQTGIYASWGFQPEDRIGDLTVGIIRERLTSRVDAVMMEAELAGILEMFEKEWFTTISE